VYVEFFAKKRTAPTRAGLAQKKYLVFVGIIVAVAIHGAI
jgi:hypothetical protein